MMNHPDNVRVDYGESDVDTAVLLLAAADRLGYEPWIVRHSEGKFYAPKDVVDEAGLEYEVDEDEDSEELIIGPDPVEPQSTPEPEEKKAPVKKASKPPARKRAAKKTAAKKTAAKKAAPKKTEE